LLFGFRCHTAISIACNTTSVVWRLCNDQPMTRREKQVDHHGQIGKAFLCPDVGDVCRPRLVRRINIELSSQGVADHDRRLGARSRKGPSTDGPLLDLKDEKRPLAINPYWPVEANSNLL
jgi:hypothetical protein